MFLIIVGLSVMIGVHVHKRKKQGARFKRCENVYNLQYYTFLCRKIQSGIAEIRVDRSVEIEKDIHIRHLSGRTVRELC